MPAWSAISAVRALERSKTRLIWHGAADLLAEAVEHAQREHAQREHAQRERDELRRRAALK